MLLLRHLQHAKHTGHANRPAAAAGRRHRCRRVRIRLILPFQIVAGGRSRRCFTAIVGHDLFRLGVVVHHEGAARDGARLRLHEPQHGLHGHGGIDGRAPRFENVAACLDRQRCVRHSHIAARSLGRQAQAVTRGGFRCRRVSGYPRTHDDRRAAIAPDGATGGVVVYDQITGVVVSAISSATGQKDDRCCERCQRPEFSREHVLSPCLLLSCEVNRIKPDSANLLLQGKLHIRRRAACLRHG